MPGTIILPRTQNPWAQMLPQLIANLAMQKIQHKAKLEEVDAAIRAKEVAIKAEAAAKVEAKRQEDINEAKIDLTKQGRKQIGAQIPPEGSITIGDTTFGPRPQPPIYNLKGVPVTIGPNGTIVKLDKKQIPWGSTEQGVRFKESEANKRAKLYANRGNKTTPTATKKNYDIFKSQNPDYQGDILEFKKAWSAKDPDEVALGLAAKDWQVMMGKKSLADAAKDYRKAWEELKTNTTKPKATRESAIKILKEKNYPITERNIKAVLQQLGE